jgi:hypothetical protein
MRKSGIISVLLLSLSVATLLAAQNEQPRRAASTAEERRRFLALTRKLEQNPLDKSLYAEKQWAMRWLIEIPDINVNVCAPVLFGTEFIQEQNKYAPQLSYQATFGEAAFIIEHPDKKADTEAQYLAGVESALKAYSAIVKSDPSAKSTALDKLLQTQREGKLPGFVRDTSKACDTDKQASRRISEMETSHA